MDFGEYEALPEGTKLSITLLAGSLAGISEHIAMYPVDTVKVSRFRQLAVRNNIIE